MKGLKQSLKKLGRSKSIASVGSGGQGWEGQEKEALIDRSIKRVAYLESFPKVIDYMGYELPGDVINPKVLDNIQDLDVRESDIFIVSYPQSGASAVEELVLKLVDKMLEKQPQGRRQRSASVSRLEAAHPYGHLRWLNALKSPRILASNLPLALMPDSVKTPVCKIIYVLRNPKDQSVSYYYQHRVKGILSSFDDFISLYMCGHLLYGDYFSHVIDYWRLSRMCPHNVFVLTFEELKLETQPMAKLMADFLGLPHVTAEDVDSICQASNRGPKVVIDMYKTVDTNDNDESGIKHHGTKFDGVIGDWLNYYSPEQSRQMDELIRQRLDRHSLSLCCDSTEAVKRLAKFGRILVDTSPPKPAATDFQTKSNGNAMKGNGVADNTGADTTGVDSDIKKRPKLAKEEFILLRNKSWIPIDVYSIESESESTGCWTRMCAGGEGFVNWWYRCCCCPCFGIKNG